MRAISLLFAAAFAIPTLAHSSDAPSFSLAKEAFYSSYLKGDKCYEVSSFEKTDGQLSDVFGVRYYVMEYIAKLTFTATCYGQYNANKKRFTQS
ncbi:MAG: hypothetical protein HXY26_07480, partial [Hydrogenophilaceae bacterium]|nr:hypothetical protein [Hydrogenophilaceae bacterium]